jgi:ketosteroid isomerase-like protein
MVLVGAVALATRGPERDTARAMSEENVELVREAFLATGSGDPAAARAVRERYFDQSIEWDMSGVVGWLEKRVYRGQEVGELLEAWAASWKTWHFDLDEVRDAGGEQVFAAIHEWGIGVESGASVDQRRYFAINLGGGRMVHVRMFSDRAEALEAAGLRE